MESSFAFLLVMVYVGCSSAYSALIKLSGNRLVLFGAINGVAALMALILFLFVPLPSLSVWPYFMGTVIAYNTMLYFTSVAYGRADLSVVFPLVKAFSFIFIMLIAFFVLGEAAAWYEWWGIGLIALGILLQVEFKKMHGLKNKSVLVLVLIAGLASACQYGFDIAGTRQSENPFSFIVLLMFIGLPSTFWAWKTHGREFRALISAQKTQIIASSLLDNVGYGAFLYAVYVVRALYAIPLSSLSVVVTTLIGFYHLKESMHLKKWASTVLITAAIAGVHLMDIFITP